MKMMKHRHLALFLCTLAFAGAAPEAFAQDYTPVPVTISRSQVSMNGKTYYAHIVLERQTIFGITKAYGVTEEDLYAANPMLAESGLKAGTVIYIPTVSEHKAEKEKPAAKEKKTEAKESKPVVVKETKPAEKKNEVKKEKPEVKKEKPVVMDTTPAPTPNADGYIEHTVKWFEDIYDVAKTYNVTAEQIMAANGLRSSRISKRQTLLIPYTEQAKESLKAKVAALGKAAAQPAQPEVAQAVPVREETPVVVPTEPVVTVTEEKPVEAKPAEDAGDDDSDDGILDWLTGKGSAEIALILPFNAAGKTSESNMDFYSGVLLALRDLEKEGVKTTLNVFDLQAGTPSSKELEDNDFVLGPISSSDLSAILSLTGGDVPVISPLD